MRHQKQQSGDLLLWRERCVIVMYKLHMKKRSVQGWTCPVWNDAYARRVPRSARLWKGGITGALMQV